MSKLDRKLQKQRKALKGKMLKSKENPEGNSKGLWYWLTLKWAK